jgi:hypothetical protein
VKRAVDFTSRADVAEWFANVMERAYEMAELAGEGAQPRTARTLSRADLRRETEATFAELRQLCRAGRRGIRARWPPTSNPNWTRPCLAEYHRKIAARTGVEACRAA